VLPLQLPNGQSPETLSLDGSETFDVVGMDARGIGGEVVPGMTLTLHIHRQSGETLTLPLLCRVDTRVEAAWLRAGGILPHALLSLENEATTTGGND
jgi:aconitase A